MKVRIPKPSAEVLKLSHRNLWTQISQDWKLPRKQGWKLLPDEKTKPQGEVKFLKDEKIKVQGKGRFLKGKMRNLRRSR